MQICENIGKKTIAKLLVQVSFTTRGCLNIFELIALSTEPESTDCDQNNNTGLIQMTNIAFKGIYNHVF